MKSPAISRNAGTMIHSLREILASIRILRPKQWVKNLFVFAGIIFSKNVHDANMLLKSVVAFILFCGISSCVYILNDIIDMEKDKYHPIKKHRPLPAGSMKRKHAVCLLILLTILTLVFSFFFSKAFTVIVLVYFFMNVMYSLILKQIVVVDIVVIAIGFVLRAISGATVIQVRISPWLLICTFLLALFLGLNKRKSEILPDRIHGRQGTSIEKYSVKMINIMLSAVVISTILSYTMYALIGAEFPHMIVTVPFVVYGVFRFQYLADRKGMGGSPELTLFRDIPLIANILLWALACIVLGYM